MADFQYIQLNMNKPLGRLYRDIGYLDRRDSVDMVAVFQLE